MGSDRTALSLCWAKRVQAQKQRKIEKESMKGPKFISKESSLNKHDV